MAENSTTPVGVEVKKLSKRFGDQVVLDDVSFSVEPGEIFVLMGPSGAGKSVLLRHLVNLEKPDSGQVLIDGKDAEQPATHREIRTALVFQAGALFNSMSVFDNLAFYPRERRLYDKSTLRDKVDRVLKILHIQDAAKKLPAELSGGTEPFSIRPAWALWALDERVASAYRNGGGRPLFRQVDAYRSH